MEGKRIEITDFIKGFTEEEILALENPPTKIYLSSDTNKMIHYNGSEFVTISENLFTNLTEISANDRYGLLGTQNAKVDSQSLIDTIADAVLNKLIFKSQIANNLTTTATGKVLDATQGKALQDNKVNKNQIVANLLATTTGNALDATMGKQLDEKKLDKTGTAPYSTVTAKLGRNGNVLDPMVFNYSGQSGQPTWLWGTNNGTDIYVWNPSDFSVMRTNRLRSYASNYDLCMDYWNVHNLSFPVIRDITNDRYHFPICTHIDDLTNTPNKRIIDMYVDYNYSPWRLVVRVSIDGTLYKRYIDLKEWS